MLILQLHQGHSCFLTNHEIQNNYSTLEISAPFVFVANKSHVFNKLMPSLIKNKQNHKFNPVSRFTHL